MTSPRLLACLVMITTLPVGASPRTIVDDARKQVASLVTKHTDTQQYKPQWQRKKLGDLELDGRILDTYVRYRNGGLDIVVLLPEQVALARYTAGKLALSKTHPLPGKQPAILSRIPTGRLQLHGEELIAHSSMRSANIAIGFGSNKLILQERKGANTRYEYCDDLASNLTVGTHVHKLALPKDGRWSMRNEQKVWRVSCLEHRFFFPWKQVSVAAYASSYGRLYVEHLTCEGACKTWQRSIGKARSGYALALFRLNSRLFVAHTDKSDRPEEDRVTIRESGKRLVRTAKFDFDRGVVSLASVALTASDPAQPRWLVVAFERQAKAGVYSLWGIH